MATIRDFQVNNGLEVNLNANVANAVTASDYFQNASMPANMPTLTFNFTTGQVLDSRLSHTRASNGYYQTQSGVYQQALPNTPRFEYANGVCKGLLIEESRTNFYYDTANPAIVGTTVPSWGVVAPYLAYVANTTAPNGTNTALIITNSLNPSDLNVFNMNRPSLYNNVVYTKSIYAKLLSGSPYVIFQAIINGSYYGNATFNLSTGVATPADANGQCSMTALANGWWRCEQTYTTDPSVAIAGDSFFLSGYGNSQTPTQIAVWGPQLEIGQNATSFIPTPPNASATRASDLVEVPINANSTWYNSLNGTLYGEYTTLTQGLMTQPYNGAGRQTGYPQQFGFMGKDPQNEIFGHFQSWASGANSIGGSTSALINFISYNNPTSNGVNNYTNMDTPIFPSTPGITVGQTVKVAFSYFSNNGANGASIAAAGVSNSQTYNSLFTGNANPTPVKLFLMQQGRYQNQPSGYFKTFKYWPTALTQSQLNYITTPT